MNSECILRESMTDMLTVRTGFPGGCVLSPVPFSPFTSTFRSNDKHYRYGLLLETHHLGEAANLVQTKARLKCHISHLEISVTKTKIIIRTKQDLSLCGQLVGTVLDFQVIFFENKEYIFKSYS